MKVHQSFEELAKRAAAELRRAYSGGLGPDAAARAVDTALTEGESHSRRLRRTQNPVGYLYRVGCSTGPDSKSIWLDNEDGTPGHKSDLFTSLAALPDQQPCSVWLVKACGWTNVQAGEALEISPELVATRVAAGVDQLNAELGISEANLSNQLRVMADDRAARVPEAAPPVPDSEPPSAPAQAARGRFGKPSKRVLAGVAAVVCVAVAATLVIRTIDSDDIEALSSIDVSFGMHDRQLVTRPDWTTPMSGRGLAGVLAIAKVGDASPVHVGNADRAHERLVPPFWLTRASQTSAIDQLDLLQQLVLADAPVDPALSLEDGPDWTISHAAGTSLGSDPAIGWLVGMVDTDAGHWVFAFNVDLPLADDEPVALSDRDRLDTVIDILREEGII